jgi:hypothetical protein
MIISYFFLYYYLCLIIHQHCLQTLIFYLSLDLVYWWYLLRQVRNKERKNPCCGTPHPQQKVTPLHADFFFIPTQYKPWTSPQL